MKPKMTTHATFYAKDYDDAREMASKAFDEFFGDHPWVFTSEEAEAETVVVDCAGRSAVICWAATFEAKVDYL